MFVCLFVGSTNAASLTFDDIPAGSIQNNYGNMPTYKGFNFSYTLTWIDVEGAGWNIGAHSGDFALLNNYRGIGIITEENGADFTFDGLWAKRWGTYPDSGGVDSLFGVLSGYNNGNLVWDVNTSLNGSYKYYSAQSGAIDELRLGFGNLFLVDDIALNEANQVPEPTSFVLLGLGLAGIGFSRKKNP